MGSHMIDSNLFRDLFGTEKMRIVFSEESFIQKTLDVEAALARAEAKLSIIPKAAADEISNKAKIENIDLVKLEKEIKNVKHPLVPLIRQLEKACDNGNGEYIHLGATTQDIIDTVTVLQVKEAFFIIMEELEKLQEVLLTLTETYRETPMPGRTHRQHAVPLTFGYKVAVWLEEINRHIERLENVKPILFVGQLAGAVGNLQSIKKDGFKLQELFMKELGLNVPTITWHTSRDNFTEFIFILGLIAGTAGKIANEIATLQRTEIQELEEPFTIGKVGSSTMPHKRNPSMSEGVISLSRIVQNNSQLLLNGMVHDHERDKVSWTVEWEVIPESCIMCSAVITNLISILKGLHVREDIMKNNLMMTNGLILSEAVMLALGEKIGKQKSHKLLYRASMISFEKNIPFSEILLKDEEIRNHLSEKEINELMNPIKHIGLSAQMADKIIEKTKKVRQIQNDTYSKL